MQLAFCVQLLIVDRSLFQIVTENAGLVGLFRKA
jgi:hypothetical protein